VKTDCRRKDESKEEFMHRPKITISTITLLCLLLTSISSLTAQTKPDTVIPDTPAGKQLKDWLRVFAGGNQDQFVRFIAGHYSKSLLDQDTAIDRAGAQARTYLDSRTLKFAA
jgi:hypothetical protein